jgi:hypothetical protein
MGTRKNRKSKKSNKRFRKTRSKRQRGGEDTPTIEEQGLCGDCSICQEPMNNVNVLIATDCNHTFHKDCLREWCQNQANTKCPLCRKPISNTCTDLSSTNISPRAATATTEIANRSSRAATVRMRERDRQEWRERISRAAVEREYHERTGHGINRWGRVRTGPGARRSGGKKRTKKSKRKTRRK